MNTKNPVYLFWWSERLLMRKLLENYGDLLGVYLAQCIAGREVIFRRPGRWPLSIFQPSVILSVGSIIHHARRGCLVWGSGIIDRKMPIRAAHFLAVRGPRTGARLQELGFVDPKVYGDPALLLPNYYAPKVEKRYRLGVVPHYTDYAQVRQWLHGREDINIIDLMTDDVEKTTNEFLACERILSSSLHGLIVAHAYGIPAIWQRYSDKIFGDHVKYEDYFESVGLEAYFPGLTELPVERSQEDMLFNTIPSLPAREHLEEIRKGLLNVCPFLPEGV